MVVAPLLPNTNLEISDVPAIIQPISMHKRVGCVALSILSTVTGLSSLVYVFTQYDPQTTDSAVGLSLIAGGVTLGCGPTLAYLAHRSFQKTLWR